MSSELYLNSHLPIQLAQKNGISFGLNDSLIEGEENTDRELIADFIQWTKVAQSSILKMEANNGDLRDIAEKQLNENKSANQ